MGTWATSKSWLQQGYYKANFLLGKGEKFSYKGQSPTYKIPREFRLENPVFNK